MQEHAPQNEGGENRADGQPETDRFREQRFQFGPWTFDVRRGLAIAAERPRRLSRLPVEAWVDFYALRKGAVPIFGPHDIDESYAMSTDLANPVLVGTMRNNGDRAFPLLIDGLHRVYRAHAEQLPYLPAYVLNAQETLAIRQDGLPDAAAYREQWHE